MLAGTLYRQVRDKFRAQGLPNADLDARLLVSAALGMSVSDLLLQQNLSVSESSVERVFAHAESRLAGKPPGRILGERHFYGRPFCLNEATLEPRPDTETLVDAVLQETGEMQSFLFCDIGTGSGAIAVSILAERPQSRAVAIDISTRALECARTNAVRHGVADRFHAVCANYASSLATGLDWIVSNPPYIRTKELQKLDQEVIEHDPILALDGGADGLSAYNHIAKDVSSLLKSSGKVAFEIGFDQANEVRKILEFQGLVDIEVIKDLAGQNRVVTARR